MSDKTEAELSGSQAPEKDKRRPDDSRQDVPKLPKPMVRQTLVIKSRDDHKEDKPSGST